MISINTGALDVVLHEVEDVRPAGDVARALLAGESVKAATGLEGAKANGFMTVPRFEHRVDDVRVAAAAANIAAHLRAYGVAIERLPSASIATAETICPGVQKPH